MPTPMVHGAADMEAGHSMTSFLSWLMSPQDYMPHGMCFLWQPELIALHVVSDSLIALAYYSIPIALVYFVLKRTDFAFPSIFVLTGLFILACGTTHAMSVWTLWYPDYRVDGGIKAITALLSIGTGVAIWKVMPLALALPSTAQLEQANQLLGVEIGQRQRAENALCDANAELEQRVAARTADLEEEVVRRRNTEATLRASEERWRSMFEASAVGIAVLDQQHHFAATNEALQKMVGYTGEELQPLAPTDITHEEDREATQKLIDDVRSGKRQGDPSEKRYRRKDGKVIWVRVSAARALDASSSFQVMPAMIEDLTATIPAEINQPLGAIIMNGNACQRFLAISPPDLDEVKDGLAAIVSDGNRASEVLSRIRGMLKNVAPERVQMDVNRAITEVLSLARHELQQHRVSVEADLHPKLPPIMADRVQLQQVVLNLVMNGVDAVRAIVDWSRVLTVRSQPDDRDNIVVSVADSGVGLDAVNLEHIFDTFFTTKANGMGMGLAISKSIIEAHHGRLWAVPEPRFGAMFAFALPSAAGASP